MSFLQKHDRFNNRQSGHGNGPCQKSKSTHNFSIFLFTNSLKSLPLRAVSLFRSDKQVVHSYLRLHETAVGVLFHAVSRNHGQLQGLARFVGVRYNFSIKNNNSGAETCNFYPVSALEFDDFRSSCYFCLGMTSDGIFLFLCNVKPLKWKRYEKSFEGNGNCFLASAAFSLVDLQVGVGSCDGTSHVVCVLFLFLCHVGGFSCDDGNARV